MAEKARTPMSGAEREAKYAAKMKEKDYETWCAKNREKMRKCIESMSEQKRKEMKRRDAERKREKRAAEKLKRNGGEYKTQAALGKARSKAMKALPSDPPFYFQFAIKKKLCEVLFLRSEDGGRQ